MASGSSSGPREYHFTGGHEEFRSAPRFRCGRQGDRASAAWRLLPRRRRAAPGALETLRGDDGESIQSIDFSDARQFGRVEKPMGTGLGSEPNFVRSEGNAVKLGSTAARSAPRMRSPVTGWQRTTARRTSEGRSLDDVVDLLIHLVSGLDHLRIGFIGALRGDQVDELFHHADVGLFGVALQQRAQAFLAAGAPDRGGCPEASVGRYRFCRCYSGRRDSGKCAS